MADEVEVKTEVNNVEADYIDRIKTLKANSVSLEEYNRVREDNKKLLDSLLNGENTVVVKNEAPAEEEKVDIQGLRNELYGGRYDGTDLDYITKVLKLRKAIMDTGAPDPAVSSGNKVQAEEADYENCQSVCDQLQEIVDYADGDSQVFRAELMRRCKK